VKARARCKGVLGTNRVAGRWSRTKDTARGAKHGCASDRESGLAIYIPLASAILSFLSGNEDNKMEPAGGIGHSFSRPRA
jgi:hypothetical protein